MPASSTTLDRVGPLASTCFTFPKVVKTSITGSGVVLVTRISISPIDSFIRRRLPATLACVTSFTPRSVATSSCACGRTWPIGSRSLVRRNNAMPFRMFCSVRSPIRGSLRTFPALQACSSSSMVLMPRRSYSIMAVLGPTSGTDISVVMPGGREARSSS